MQDNNNPFSMDITLNKKEEVSQPQIHSEIPAEFEDEEIKT
jgi:hypothetical protein